ncbi:MAG: cysteine desulfurase family protein [Acidobacteriota bacterium]
MQRIYLDANATTPVLPDVLEAMLPFLREGYGNPSSAHHSGQRTRSAVERARASVARLLNCSPKEIVFTSGGTESDNLALRGVLEPFLDKRQSAHLITSQIEHHAALYTAEALHRRRIDLTTIPATRDGVIDPSAFEAALTPRTELVSIMLANNETGAIQPVGKLARIAKNYNPSILVHTDAVQAAGKIPIDLGGPEMAGEFKNVDLLSISGHKMYAPQGTGALFIRKGLHLAPLFHGGPHERQRRAGTENVPGIVALGKAADLAHDFLSTPNAEPTSTNSELKTLNSKLDSHPFSSTPAHLQALRDRLEHGLLARIPNSYINAANAPRVPNTTSLRIEGIDAESLLIALDMQGISASFGAACQSGATEPSHVLFAMGYTAAEARSTLRLSLSRLTTPEEITRTLEILPATVARLRSLA